MERAKLKKDVKSLESEVRNHLKYLVRQLQLQLKESEVKLERSNLNAVKKEYELLENQSKAKKLQDRLAALEDLNSTAINPPSPQTSTLRTEVDEVKRIQD
ncbi:hypothetical protein CYMTET_25874, partial [Cymbomonas tetramitiformis]